MSSNCSIIIYMVFITSHAATMFLKISDSILIELNYALQLPRLLEVAGTQPHH